MVLLIGVGVCKADALQSKAQVIIPDNIVSHHTDAVGGGDDHHSPFMYGIAEAEDDLLPEGSGQERDDQVECSCDQEDESGGFSRVFEGSQEEDDPHDGEHHLFQGSAELQVHASAENVSVGIDAEGYSEGDQ